MPTKTSDISSTNEWYKLIIDNKFIFYNSKYDLLAYHPPFPLQNLSQFLKFYQFNITPDDFMSYLNGTVPQLTKNNEYKDKQLEVVPQQLQIDTSPLTSEKELKDLIALCKTESIEKVLNRICYVKFKMMPSYEYVTIDKNKFQCQLKIQNKILYKSDVKESKPKARNDVDMKTVQNIVPSIFNELVRIEEDKKNKKMQKYQQYKNKTFNHCTNNNYNNNRNNHNVYQPQYFNNNVYNIYNNHNTIQEKTDYYYLNKKRPYQREPSPSPSPQFSVDNDNNTLPKISKLKLIINLAGP